MTKEKFGLTFKLEHNKLLKPQDFIHNLLKNAIFPQTKSDVHRDLIVNCLGACERPEQHISRNGYSSIAPDFSPLELVRELRLFNDNKAPSLDCVGNRMVKNIDIAILGLILGLMNKFLQLGSFPDRTTPDR